ncbi:uncharacterized protein [Miscanthus floridulus]|uniref:uncharacterized protein n=1 Tax=Miscanthus floridulus TaxID=154761 RepID=UPI003458251B
MDSLKPLSLPHFFSSLAFSPCSPFAHHHGVLEARFSATLRLAPPAALSNGRVVAARCPGLLQPSISNSAVNSCAQPLTLKSTKTGSTGEREYAVSVMQGYQYHEHMQDPDKNKMMTYSKVEKNAKSIVKIKGVHSGFLPSVARKECAANHGRSRDFCNITLQVCVWGATFCANLSHQRVANAPRAMAGD